MKTIKTFEDYLMQIAPDGVHTNNSPEGFDRWVENLDVSEVMEYAEEYGELKLIEGETRAYNEANSFAKTIN